MILEQQKSEATYIGDIQENKVGIDARNIDFIASLLTSNLYTLPLKSFFREAVSNAYDSHMEAGTDENILMLIEDSSHYNEYQVSIRDYGTGLDDERFDSVYRNIGSSTKRDSNDYIGMLGIGRLAVLSCTDMATVISYYNGTKKTYVMYKNGGGINIDLISTVQGDFKNGLEVSTKLSFDSATFKDALYALVFFDKLYVKYTGIRDIKYYVNDFNNRKVSVFDTFSTCELLPSQTSVRFGRVVYPLPQELLSKKLRTNRIAIHLPLGDADITPSRETFISTQKTLGNVEKCIQKAKDELQQLFDSIMQKDKTAEELYNLVDNLTLSIPYEDEIHGAVEIYTSDITMDCDNVMVEGKIVPKGLVSALVDARWAHIPKEYVEKTNLGRLAPRIWYILLRCDIYYKGEERMFKTTYDYFIDYNKDYIVIKYACLGAVIRLISENPEIQEWVLDHMNIKTLKNGDVPKDYLKSLKEIKTKTDNIYVTRIGYRNMRMEFEEFCKTYLGIVVVAPWTYDSTTLDIVYEIFHRYAGFNIVKMREQDFHLIVNNKRFVHIDDFFDGKLFRKLMTGYVIYNHYNSVMRTTPKFKDFKKAFRTVIPCIEGGIWGREASFLQKYIDSGFYDDCLVKYYSPTQEDMDYVTMKYEIEDHSREIIDTIIYRKCGNREGFPKLRPKINLNKYLQL